MKYLIIILVTLLSFQCAMSGKKSKNQRIKLANDKSLTSVLPEILKVYISGKSTAGMPTDMIIDLYGKPDSTYIYKLGNTFVWFYKQDSTTELRLRFTDSVLVHEGY